MSTYPQPAAFPEGAAFSAGVWVQRLTCETLTRGRPALFLDRDGVLIEEKHYLHKSEEVALTPNACETLKAANANAIAVILVTNQAGIGLGYYGWDDFIAVQKCIHDELALGGAHLDGVFACPFHAKAEGVYAHESHPARKPNPGMLLLARDLMGIDLSTSWIVGDRDVDILAGKNAGLEGAVHVWTGHGSRAGEREAAKAAADETYTVALADNLECARSVIPLLR